MKPAFSQILQKAAAQPTTEEKIAYLQKNGQPFNSFITLLRFTFDPRIKFLLPEGKTPYKPTESLDQEHRLFHEIDRIFILCSITDENSQVSYGHKELGKDTKPMIIKRQQKWIQILESIFPADAVLMDAVKDKYFPYDGINEEIVRKAFPNQIFGDKEFFENLNNSQKETKRKKSVSTEVETPANLQ